MLQDAGWASYLSARRAALCRGIDAQSVESVGRAERRLAAYLTLSPAEARRQARRCALFAADAAFHDQLVGAGRIGVLRTLGARTPADLPEWAGSRGALVVSLHYGPATAILPLCLAARSRAEGTTFAVVQNSRSNPAVVLRPARQAELAAAGFPILDLDIARLGEIGVLRRTLSVLSAGGTALIFTDGQLPRPAAGRTVVCRLGRGRLAFPRGPEWLARNAAAPLLPLVLRPERDTYRMVSLPLVRADDAPAAYQALVDVVAEVDPAPWSRWCCGADHF